MPLTDELVILVDLHRVVMLIWINFVCLYLYSMFVLYEILSCLMDSIHIEPNITWRSHCLRESSWVVWELAQSLNLIIILSIFLFKLADDSSVYSWNRVSCMGRVGPHVSFDSLIIFYSIGLLCAYLLMTVLWLCHFFFLNTSSYPHLRHLLCSYSFH